MADVATLTIKADSTEIKTATKDLDKMETQSGKTEKATEKLEQSYEKMARSAKTFAIGVGVIGTAITAAAVIVGAKAIGMASDMEETQGKFDVVFRGMTDSAESWSKNLVDAYAMSEVESKKYLSSIQDLLVPTGLAREEAGKLSNQFVQMAADLGSFNNLPTSQVIMDIQSALQGSSETMAKYGINVKAAKVEQEILNSGLAASKAEITDAHKAQAIYNIMMREGADAVGDMARTQDSFANQQKKALANIEDFTTELGNSLLPLATDVVKGFNEWFKVNGELMAQDLSGWITGGVDAFKWLIDVLSEVDNFFGFVIGEMLIGWEELVHAWNVGVLGIESSFSVTFDQISEKTADFLETTAEGLAFLPVVGDEISENLGNAAESIRDSSTASEEFQGKLEGLRVAHELNIQSIREVQNELVMQGHVYNDLGETSTRVEAQIQENSQKSSEVLIEETEKRNKSQIELEQQLTEEIDKLTLSRFALAKTQMDKEYANMLRIAGEDKKLQELAVKWREEKYKKITQLDQMYSKDAIDEMNNMKDSWQTFEEGKTDISKEENEKRWEIEEETVSKMKGWITEVVEAFVAGEDIKTTIAGIAAGAIIDFTADAASRGIAAIIEAAVSAAGGYLFEGFSGTMAEGEDWKSRLAQGASFLAQAGIGFAVIKNMTNDAKGYADGGWLDGNANGGVINQGSGVRDDVFLGATGTPSKPVFNFGMGGEFVINKDQTSKHRRLLEAINSGELERSNFATGGDLDEKAKGLSTKVNGGGFSTFVEGWVEDGTPGGWREGVKRAISYYATYGVSAALAKELPADTINFADGGIIRNFGLGDFLDPGNVFGDGGLDFGGFGDPLGDIIGESIFGSEKWDNITDPGNIGPWITGDGDLDWEGLISPEDDIGSDLFGGDLWDKIKQWSGADIIGDLMSNLGVGEIAKLIWGDDWFDKWFDLGFRDTADDVIFPWVRQGVDPSVTNLNWEGAIEDNINDAFKVPMQNLWDGIKQLIDPLDIFNIGGWGEGRDLMDEDESNTLGQLHGGLDFVPETGSYFLQRGESVVPVGGNTNAEMIQAIKELQAQLHNENFQIAKNGRLMLDVVEKWDGDGLPTERTET